jgi:hypothetical protein
MNEPKDDITLDPEWISEQVNRLAGWEYLNRYVRHKLDKPMLPQELCDKIGVHKGYIYEMTKSVKKKLNAK